MSYKICKQYETYKDLSIHTNVLYWIKPKNDIYLFKYFKINFMFLKLYCSSPNINDICNKPLKIAITYFCLNVLLIKVCELSVM